MTATDVLFRPFRIGAMDLANRIVMAPMTRSFAPSGVPDAAHAAYYRRRAEGGVGLILSEGTVIDRPASRNDPGVPFFHGDEALKGWSGVIDAVHDGGARMGPQLWHTGALKSFLTEWVPAAPVESPSGLAAPGIERGVAMTDGAIADTIELHGAHGYLFDQFFWAATNRRTDRYGGATIGERSRFAAEVVAAVRASVGPDFPIILRLSQWKVQDFSARLAETPDLMAAWLMPMVEAGVDVLHCSQRRFWEPEFPDVDGEHGLNFAGWAKKLTGAATISVGSVGLTEDFMGAFSGEGAATAKLDNLIERMERDEFDLIAVGRALIADPAWPEKVRTGNSGALKGFDASALAELV
jgi:2,4-dienoyl-CoA reductase-like NADH-dependent reductase (Old Yellow Enzyme family)